MTRKANEREIKELKRRRGPELMRHYGAHAMGVGHKTVGGERTGDLALVFYVERKGSAEQPIPPTLELGGDGAGDPVEVPTDVVESPRAQLEEG